MLCGIDIELNEIGASRTTESEDGEQKDGLKDLRALFGDA
jgi:hypothetical protein